MKYNFKSKKLDGTWSGGWAESCDGVVVLASPAFLWARGKPIAELLEWLQARRFNVKVSDDTEKEWTPLIECE